MRELTEARVHQAMEEYATILLNAQEEKHKEEMGNFAEWLVLNTFSSNGSLWYSDSDKYNSSYKTTEIIEMFKKSLEIMK